jgi:pimeloyl-ACP methyl ester carboxylesterase
MTAFVLLHGGGMGGWVWRYVARPLRAAGHDVFTPTFTGFGERHHLLSRRIDDAVHVADIVNMMACEEVRDAVLVAHSYGGAIAPGVCAAAPERISRLVMVDAIVLEQRESVAEALGFLSPEQADGLRAMHARDEGPIGAGVPEQVRRMAEIEPQRMSPERDRWTFEHLTDMPLSANLAKVRVGAESVAVPVDYLTVPLTMMQKMHARAAALGWTVHDLGGDRDHMVHVGDPEIVLSHLTA